MSSNEWLILKKCFCFDLPHVYLDFLLQSIKDESMRLFSTQVKQVLVLGLLAISIDVQATAKTEQLQININTLVAEEFGKVSHQMGVVINLSGRQRMLTQKMSKEMLLIYHNIEAKKNRTNLGKSALMFAKTLKGLVNGDKKLKLNSTTDKDILKQMDIVSGLWLSFSKSVLPAISGAKVDLSFIKKIAKQNLPLLAEMNKAVGLYEKAAGSDLNDLSAVVNISGRQRMLTQKMTKEFLLIAAHVNEKENKENLKSTVALFDRTLKSLRDGDPSQGVSKTEEPVVLKQLLVIEKLWGKYKLVMITMDVSKKGLKNVADLNMPLLQEMNAAVKMYEVLSDRG